jgi:DivIVA domain-containing protein
VTNDSIGSIRSATFTVARRGYDKREVDGYLSKLADWLESGGADQAAQDTVRRELERIGQKTGKILTAAEDAARSIKADAEGVAQDRLEDAGQRVDSVHTAADKYSSQTRSEADGYAAKTQSEADRYSEESRGEADAYGATTRREADEYAGRIREEADRYDTDTRAEADHAGKQKTAAALAKAKALVEEGQKRREQIEKVISDLEKRRDAVLSELEKLSTDLAGTATSYKPGEGPGDGAAEDAPTEKVQRPAAASASE